MRIGAGVVGVMVAAALGAPASPAAAVSAQPGLPVCGGVLHATAHRGGAAVSPQPAGAPVPCGLGTGFAAAESHIVTTATGTVLYVPAVLPSGALGTGEGPGPSSDTQGNAAPAGLAASTDRGAHWSLVQPDGVTWNPTDHGDYVDPATGRFFFEDYGPIPLAPQIGPVQDGPAHVMWTDDLRAWHHTVIANLVLPENPRFTSAPAPAGQAKPVGYPNVVYFCANTNVGFTGPAIAGRLCFRSLDGGSTWTQASELLSSSKPVHPECGSSGETLSAVDGYYPVPQPDGSLYVLIACGAKTFLARSSDEAASFPILRTPAGAPIELNLPADSITTLGSGPQLGTDPAGDLFIVYPTIVGSVLTRLSLTVSTDHGSTWSAPADLTAPGVTGILRWAMAIGSRGQLGLAYIGQRAGEAGWDAYLGVATDPLDKSGRPLVWSTVTDPSPLLFTNHIEGAGFIVGQGEIAVPYPFPLGIQPAGPVAAGNDFIGVTVGADGTVWGSFDQDCGPAPSATGCQADNDQTRGFVGVLTSAAAVPVPVAATTSGNGAPPGPALPATGGSTTLALLGIAAGIGALLAARQRRRASGRA